MGPIPHYAVRAKVVGVALGFDGTLRRFSGLIFEAMLGREGGRFIFGREFDPHLVALHILAADPAHQTISPFGSVQFEFQHPVGSLGQAGLHGGFRRFIDACNTHNYVPRLLKTWSG